MCTECEGKFCAENPFDEMGKKDHRVVEGYKKHEITHRVLVINERDVEKYKHLEKQEAEQNMDVKTMIMDIKKRLEKLELEGGGNNKGFGDVKKRVDETAETVKTIRDSLQQLLKGRSADTS